MDTETTGTIDPPTSSPTPNEEPVENQTPENGAVEENSTPSSENIENNKEIEIIEENTPVETTTENKNQENSETQKEENTSTPVVEEAVPVVEEQVPAVVEQVPATVDVPAVEEVPVVAENTSTPVVEEVVPVVEEQVPAVVEQVPAAEEQVPATVDVPAVEEVPAVEVAAAVEEVPAVEVAPEATVGATVEQTEEQTTAVEVAPEATVDVPAAVEAPAVEAAEATVDVPAVEVAPEATVDVPAVVEESAPVAENREVANEEEILDDYIPVVEDTTPVESVTNTLNELSITDENEKSYFDGIAPEVYLRIFSYLELEDLLTVQRVSKDWLEYGRADILWQNLYNNTSWSSELNAPLEVSSWYDAYRIRYQSQMEQIGLEYIEELRNVSEFAPVSAEKIAELKESLSSDNFLLALQRNDETVIHYLESPQTILAMMAIVFTEPPISDEAKRQRVMQIAVHTLISALVTDILISHRPLLDRLFDIVENLNFQEDEDILVKSDCFHQIITALLDKDNNDPDALAKLIAYFQTRENFVPTLILNARDANITEIIYKFVECYSAHQWLLEASLIENLIALLHPDFAFDIQENSAHLLVNILESCQSYRHSVLVNDVLNNEVITESVLEYMKAKPLNGEAIKLGVEIFNKIIALIGDELEEPPAVVTKLTNSIDLFTLVLKDSECLGPNPSVVLTTGPLKHGFGFVRLAVLDLLVSLLYTGFPVVVEGMLNENVFPTILNLLFDYPWNNIAHQRIVMLYSGLFCCNNFDSIQTILTQSLLPQRIADAHKTAEERLAGYYGHLRELANEIVKITKQSDQIANLLGGIDSWVDFVAGDLQVMNTKECVYQDIFSIGGDDGNQFGEDSSEFYEAYDEYEVVEEDFYQSEYDEGAYEEVSDSPQEI